MEKEREGKKERISKERENNVTVAVEGHCSPQCLVIFLVCNVFRLARLAVSCEKKEKGASEEGDMKGEGGYEWIEKKRERSLTEA